MLLTAFVPAWKMLRRVADGADVDGCVRTAMCVRAYPSGFVGRDAVSSRSGRVLCDLAEAYRMPP